MKVLLLNGSPHKEGCTYTALKEIENTLNEEGIETEIFNLGTDVISGCRGCGACRKIGKCVIDDKVNEFVKLAESADGFVFGSPVHYAAISGSVKSFLDRVFFSGSKEFTHKLGASIVSARRAGTTAALDELNKYFLITQMPIVPGSYWNMVHGCTPEEVVKDIEGMQNMRILARNVAWLLKNIEAGKNAGVPMPKKEEFIFTNFIR